MLAVKCVHCHFSSLHLPPKPKATYFSFLLWQRSVSRCQYVYQLSVVTIMQCNKKTHRTSVDTTTCLLCSCLGISWVSSGQLCWSLLGSLTNLRICWLWASCPLALDATIQLCSTSVVLLLGSAGRTGLTFSWRWMTEVQASKPRFTNPFKPLLVSSLVNIPSAKSNDVIEPILLGVVASHPVPVGRACIITYMAEAMATGSDRRWGGLGTLICYSKLRHWHNWHSSDFLQKSPHPQRRWSIHLGKLFRIILT